MKLSEIQNPIVRAIMATLSSRSSWDYTSFGNDAADDLVEELTALIEGDLEDTQPAAPVVRRNRVVIMRGVPGSGKSHRARQICEREGGIIVSADHFFEDPDTGEYNFNPRLIGQAHAECMSRFLALLQLGEPTIIVDNTNTQRWEWKNYETAAQLKDYSVQFVELPCIGLDDVERFAARNTHGVPVEAIKAMYERWEER